jgi:hypothetical protein
MYTDLVLNSPMGADGVGVDFIQPGTRFETGLLRPYIDMHTGQRMVTINTGRSHYDDKTNQYLPVYEEVPLQELVDRGVNTPVANASSLRKDEWIQLDQVVLRAARSRLRAWADLAAANTYGGFNGMSKMVLEHETVSDPGEAQVDMDGLTEGRTDSPKFQLEALPLPITHSDFTFSQRRLAISRNTGTPLDTFMAEAAGRRVAESIEKTLIGVNTGLTYGADARYNRASSVYGYTNFPDRLTYNTITAPNSVGWKPQTTVDNVIAMRELLYDANFYGPFMLYCSNDWDQYLDGDYYALATSGMVAPTQTLRERLSKIVGIQGIRRLDYFTSTFSMVLVQMTSDVARAVNGMDITTVQWESQGGMRLNFKVMAIQVPQLRADYSGNCGICHGTTA